VYRVAFFRFCFCNMRLERVAFFKDLYSKMRLEFVQLFTLSLVGQNDLDGVVFTFRYRICHWRTGPEFRRLLRLHCWPSSG
jgi:hypothetical protein